MSKITTRRAVFHPFLGQRIKYLRKKKDLTQKELGVMAGYTTKSSGRISQIEHGLSGFAVDKLDLFCKALDADSKFLTYEGPIDEEDFELTNLYFKMLRNKEKSQNFQAVKLLIESDSSIK